MHLRLNYNRFGYWEASLIPLGCHSSAMILLGCCACLTLHTQPYANLHHASTTTCFRFYHRNDEIHNPQYAAPWSKYTCDRHLAATVHGKLGHLTYTPSRCGNTPLKSRSRSASSSHQLFAYGPNGRSYGELFLLHRVPACRCSGASMYIGIN